MPRIIVKDHKYYFKIRGLGGPKGDKGDTGPAGPQGPQGPYVNVVAGTTTTLPAGSSAQVTVNNIGNTSTLNFGIPQGSKGDKGDAGTPGAQGPRGFAATVNVGETTTGQPGTNASVVNAGNEHDAVLKFTIPRGEKGETGETGPQGPTGGVKSTVVTELPETGESDKYYLVYRDSEGGTIATTDGRAQIENGENGGDLTVSQLLGNAEQTTYSGKNLLKLGDGEATSVGISVPAVSDNSITVKAESGVGTYDSRSYDIIGLQPGQQYTMSCNISGAYSGANGATVRIDNGHTGGASAILGTLETTNPTLTFTVPEGSEKLGIYFYVAYGQTPTVGSTATFTNIQLEKGSTVTSYEPYVGGTASPNPSYPQSISTVTGGQVVGIAGKNQQSNTWGQDFVDAINDVSKASVQTYDGKNCLKYAVSAGYGSYPTKNFTLGIKFQPSTQYTFSFDMLKTNAQAITFAIWYSNGTYTTTNVGDAGADEWHHYEITSTAGKTVMYATPFYTAGDAYIDIDTFQIEIGTSASQFVPYYGQKFEINLGKNLTDLSTFTFGYVTSTGEIQVSHLMGEMVSPFVKVEPNTAYTFKIFKTTGTNQGWFGVGEYTSESTSSFIRRDTNTVITATSITFTTSATTNYVRVSARNLEQATKVQLEKGSISTSWAEYFTPIELAKIGNYQDRIYKSEGKWYIEKQVGKVVFNGSETWSTSGSVYYTSALASTIAPTPATEHYLGLSNYFEVVGFDYQSATNLFFHPNKNLQVKNTNWATINDWKTWLASNPTTVYYALATPTTTEITDETLLLQLNFLASLYKGENNISLVGTGAQGELTGNYVVYDKYNRHKVYIWSSDDNTWQIIVQ
jgi:hypothetical protein